MELANQAGTVTGSYAYTPWGAVSSHIGTSTPLQYGGGYADAETGLIYLQARYYDPVTAVFVSVDALVSRTLAAYLYASNDPLNRLAPLGLWDWGWSSDTWKIIGVVALAVGAVALLATGVGAVVDLGILGGFIAAEGTAATIGAVADGVAVGAGAAGTLADGLACAGHNDQEACAGAVLNGVGLGGGAAGLGFARAGFDGAEYLARGLGAGTAPAAVVGYGVDVHSFVKSCSRGE